MKKALLGATMLSMVSGLAAAADLRYNDQARVVDVQTVYKTVVSNNAPVCHDERVKKIRYETRTRRVTQQSGSNSGDVVAGAIIGGLLGGTATNSDQGAVVGAIIGGAIANENSNGGKVTREVTERVPVEYYVTERVCSNNASESIRNLEQKITQTQRWAASGNRDNIRKLQRRVGVAADGVSGPATRRATTRYIWGLEDRIAELRSNGGGSSERVVDYYKVAVRYNNQRFFVRSNSDVDVGDVIPVTVSVDVR